ncbi:MAG: hypothetical protein V1862_01185 [Methanobacteriota archaeon]
MWQCCVKIHEASDPVRYHSGITGDHHPAITVPDKDNGIPVVLPDKGTYLSNVSGQGPGLFIHDLPVVDRNITNRGTSRYAEISSGWSGSRRI